MSRNRLEKPNGNRVAFSENPLVEKALQDAKDRWAKRETPASQLHVEQTSEQALKTIRKELKELKRIFEDVKTNTETTEQEIQAVQREVNKVALYTFLLACVSVVLLLGSTKLIFLPGL